MGEVVTVGLSLGAVLMVWDFVMKLWRTTPATAGAPALSPAAE
jgi:hypothetical protein